MNIEIDNYEPYIEVVIKNEKLSNIKIKCLVDTGFSGILAIPYFVWKNDEKSLVNKIDFIDTPKLLKEENYLETATWTSKTYKSFITLEFNSIKIKSKILIYKHNLEYASDKDHLILEHNYFVK